MVDKIPVFYVAKSCHLSAKKFPGSFNYTTENVHKALGNVAKRVQYERTRADGCLGIV